jgi:hypothetical protein
MANVLGLAQRLRSSRPIHVSIRSTRVDGRPEGEPMQADQDYRFNEARHLQSSGKLLATGRTGRSHGFYLAMNGRQPAGNRGPRAIGKKSHWERNWAAMPYGPP